MRARLLRELGWIGLAALTVLAAAPARAELPVFPWPDNPFAYTLSDDLFVDAGEARFDKAVRVFDEAMSGIPGELFGIVSYPVTDPLTFGTFALGVGALTLVDRPTTTLYQKTILPIGERFDLPRPFDIRHVTTDEQYIAGAIAGTYAYGLIANDERSQVAALLASKAVLYSYFTTHVVLKAAFGRMRPVKDLTGPDDPSGVFSKDPFDFFNSTGVKLGSDPFATGMPSFHFTLYFSTARVFSGVYDNYAIPYGVAAALALNSAEGHNHWVSDMVAGALIGTGIGNLVLNSYEDRKRGLQGTVVPIMSSKGAGLGLEMRF